MGDITVRNIGEAIAIFGIMVGIGMTKNYYLLLLLILPLSTWLKLDTERNGEEENLNLRKKELEIEKLEKEIKLMGKLKGKKK